MRATVQTQAAGLQVLARVPVRGRTGVVLSQTAVSHPVGASKALVSPFVQQKFIEGSLKQACPIKQNSRSLFHT